VDHDGTGEATVELLHRARDGDRDALETLFRRCLPPLQRWARGRLPAYARTLLNTDDLVQETVYRTLRRLDAFESRHEGALLAYLRQSIVNRIRDEVRGAMRRPVAQELGESRDHPEDPAASPLEEAIGREAVERYEAAMARLRPEDREAIVARVELQQSYAAVATALGKANPDAARMTVARALVRLAEEMQHG
jgi:RNA polymerase sigma-70 factor (ECF subfamily)